MIAGLLGPRRQVRLQQPPLEFSLRDRREHGPERRRIEIDLVAAEQLEVRADVRRKQRERSSHIPGAVLLLCEARAEEDREWPFLQTWDLLRQGAHHRSCHGPAGTAKLGQPARPLAEAGELDPPDMHAALPALEIVVPAAEDLPFSAGDHDLERCRIVGLVDRGRPHRRGGGCGRARDQEMAHMRPGLTAVLSGLGRQYHHRPELVLDALVLGLAARKELGAFLLRCRLLRFLRTGGLLLGRSG